MRTAKLPDKVWRRFLDVGRAADDQCQRRRAVGTEIVDPEHGLQQLEHGPGLAAAGALGQPTGSWLTRTPRTAAGASAGTHARCTWACPPCSPCRRRPWQAAERAAVWHRSRRCWEARRPAAWLAGAGVAVRVRRRGALLFSWLLGVEKSRGRRG